MKPDQFFRHWKQTRQQLYAMIDRFQEGELTYQPFPTWWTAGQIMLHVAESEDYWVRCVILKEIDISPKYALADYPTKDKIKGKLEESHGRTEKFLTGLEEADLQKALKYEGDSHTLYWIIWHMIEHEIHHRGELSLILGMLGKKGWGD
ncbi:MAG TPA: DinB family protein [Longilinea sp.]|nr:DinB family protein [Longilinea sp.]